MSKPNAIRARSALWFRQIGSTGLFVALLGLIPLSTTMPIRSPGAWSAAIARFISELPGFKFSSRLQAISLAMIGIGGALFLISLGVQLLAGLRMMAGRRNAAATNSAVQIALVLLLLFGVNAYSFRHYQRLDWTRARQFTLPESITSELSKLRGQSDTVADHRHNTIGRASANTDAH